MRVSFLTLHLLVLRPSRGEVALGCDVLEDRQEELECLAAAAPHLATMLLAPEGDPDALDIPTPCSYREVILVPPPGANIVSGMWIFRVMRPPSSPPAFKARYVARGFSQRQGVEFFHTFSPTPKMTTLRVSLHVAAQHDYELHSLDFSTAFLQGSFQQAIWLHCPPGFTGRFLRVPSGAYGDQFTACIRHLTTTVSAEGDRYLCVPLDPGIEAAALGASESALPGTTPAEALHTFTLDSGASRCFFRSLHLYWSDWLTPQGAQFFPVPPLFSRVRRFRPAHSQVFISPRSLRTWSGSTPLLVSPPVAPDSPVAPPPWSPLPATPLWHALPPPCFRSSQHAAPHSSSFPLTTAPQQTLHVDVWGPARVSGQGRERYFVLVVDDYTRYTTVFPLRSKGEVPDVLIPWVRAVCLQLRERLREDLPVLRLHSDRGGEFSSDLLRDFVRGEGILQSFSLLAFPQKNGIAERRIGLVMEVARTSMIHVVAPLFLWPFALRYAAHKLNLWPHVSLLETSPTLGWTGKVGDGSVFRVWGSRAFVRDTSPDKLSARAIPGVFLGFPPDTRGRQFYQPTLCRVLPSQDVTFDELVPFYRLLPYRSAPLPPLQLFLAPDPLLGTVPIEVAVDSGAARGAAFGGDASRGATSGGAEPAGAEREGAESEGARSGGAELGGAELAGAELGDAELEGAEPGDAEPEGAEPGGAESEGAASGGAEPRGTAFSGGALPRLSPRPEPLSPEHLHNWFAWRTRLRSGATGAGVSAARGTGAGGTGATSLGGVGVLAGEGGPGGARAAGLGGACTTGTGAAGAGGAVGTGAGGAGAGDHGAGGARAVDPGAGGAGAGGVAFGGTGAAGVVAGDHGVGDIGGGGAGHGERCEPLSRHALLVHVVRTGRRVPRPRNQLVPGTHHMALRPSSVPQRVPLPSPPTSSPANGSDPKSEFGRDASPTVPRLLATVVTDPSFESAAASTLVAELVDFVAACRLDYATSFDAEYEQEELECLAAAAPHLVSMLLAPEGDPDAPDIPTPHSYAEAIVGEYSSQWQTAMDAEMASWKSTGTYVDEVPPPGANIVSGMWIFRGVDFFQTFSPTPNMTTLRVLLHVAAQRDYELHSLESSTAFLQGSLHKEIWLRRPPGFTGLFPPGTQWSLRRLVYGLRQAPREWHDTLRTTLAALGFAPSTADPSLFLRTDTSLPPFYILVYVDDLVFATADTEALALVKSELQKRHTCTDLEPSGPYPELVGCLMYLMTCTRPDLAYPLGLLARYVAPGWHRKVHMDAAKRVLRYLCGTSGMGLVLGGWSAVVLTRHSDASWVDDQATQRSSQGYTFSLGSGSVSWRSTCSSSVLSSSCEAEIYAGAMAAQELRWLTYLMTDLGERPHSPPVLYQRGQLCLAHVATRANTADIFTKALPSGDHQRFCTLLGLVPTLPHLL
ncbi:unnamed protein product [Closterium sp. NIES-53]